MRKDARENRIEFTRSPFLELSKEIISAREENSEISSPRVRGSKITIDSEELKLYIRRQVQDIAASQIGTAPSHEPMVSEKVPEMS